MTCYAYGVGPWTKTHVHVLYKTTKGFQMTCWETEEQVLNMAWPNDTTLNVPNATKSTAAAVYAWWERAQGQDPETGRCMLNSSANCSTETQTRNQTMIALADLLSVSNAEVEIWTLNLTRLLTKRAACTWIKIEGEQPQIYCNWSCAALTSESQYGYLKSDTIHPAVDTWVACSGLFLIWDNWNSYDLRCPASDKYIENIYRWASKHQKLLAKLASTTPGLTGNDTTEPTSSENAATGAPRHAQTRRPSTSSFES